MRLLYTARIKRVKMSNNETAAGPPCPNKYTYEKTASTRHDPWFDVPSFMQPRYGEICILGCLSDIDLDHLASGQAQWLRTKGGFKWS
jgi:hypothetical protein